jgi:ABC-type lipoprotein release transport system permease subunit
MTLNLVVKSLRFEKLRFITAVAGVATATGLFVWSLGLTVTAMHQSRERARRMTAPFNCWISNEPTGVGRPPRSKDSGAGRRKGGAALNNALAPDFVQAIKAHPEIISASAFSVTRATVDYRPDGRILQGPPLTAYLSAATPSGCPYTEAHVKGEWPDAQGDEPLAAVCSALFTPRRLDPPAIGSTLVLLTKSGTVTVKISAIIDFPETIRGFPNVFTTDKVLRQAKGIPEDPLLPNLLLCEMQGQASTAKLRDIASSLMAESSILSALNFCARRETEASLTNDNLRNFKRQAPLLLTLSVLTAFCMLINSLTVGIEQKIRELALLRSLGMTQQQVMRMIFGEAALVGFSGWIIGTFGGWTLLALFAACTPETFPEGSALGWYTPLLAGAGVALITAVSLIWPCRRAMRIHPLDALKEEIVSHKQPSTVRTITGIALLFPMLIFTLPLPLSALWRSILLLVIGIPSHITGLLLALPMLIIIIERCAVPPICALLAIDRQLLRQRVSRHFAQTAGMVLLLAVGLGTYVAIHIWGGSMMAPFLPSKEFPDVIVSILPNGVPRGAHSAVAVTPGIRDGRCLEIEARQFNLASNMIARTVKASGRPPSFPNIILFGADPQSAFGGDNPLAPWRFVQGNRSEAAQALQQGDACLITSMFARETGLHIGDNLTFNCIEYASGKAPKQQIDNIASLKVAGVIDLNWHLVTSRAQLRGRNNMPSGTMGPVFVNQECARRFSGNRGGTYFLWANLSDAYRARGALEAGIALEKDIRAALRIDEANTVRVHHRDEIADGTLAHGAHLIGDMARAPFWSLIVLSTGIITLLLASFQNSAREIAVMRAVGLTRSQLTRILAGEAMITGICGISLSILSGFFIGWTFTGWTRAWMPFGGLPMTLSIPWLIILRGAVFAFALCIIMALPLILWLVRQREQRDF